MRGRTHFRVWAPKANRVDVVLESSPENEAERTFHPLQHEGDGYFSGAITAEAGAFYRFRDQRGGNISSRSGLTFSTGGPHRSSCVVDPSRVPGATSNGTACACRARSSTKCISALSLPKAPGEPPAKELAELARIGITVIEMMPIADFPGEFGWGYDGVDLFAPCRLYGTPDDLARLYRSRALVRPRRNSRCRLQPSRSGRKLSARLFRTLFYRPHTRTTGATRSILTDRTPDRSVNFSSRTPATGSKNFISTAFVSMPQKASSTSRTSTSSARSVEPPARPRVSVPSF